MNSEIHPDFETLFNYFCSTPARQLDDEERGAIKDHVNGCVECHTLGQKVVQFDDVWDLVLSVRETKEEAESLEDDLASVRPRIGVTTSGYLIHSNPSLKTRSRVKKWFGDLKYFSQQTREYTNLSYAAATDNSDKVMTSTIEHTLSFSIEDIHVDVFVAPNTGKVFLQLPIDRFTTLRLDESEYHFSNKGGGPFSEVVGLSFVDLVDFLEKSKRGESHSLILG